MRQLNKLFVRLDKTRLIESIEFIGCLLAEHCGNPSGFNDDPQIQFAILTEKASSTFVSTKLALNVVHVRATTTTHNAKQHI